MLDVDATILVVIVLVWILVLVLSRVFFRPMSRLLDKRRSQLEGDQAATAKALEKYDGDLRRIEGSLKEAKAESANIREKAEIEALKEKGRLLQEVQAECRAQVEKGKAELDAELERLKKELDAKTETLAADIEQRILNG